MLIAVALSDVSLWAKWTYDFFALTDSFLLKNDNGQLNHKKNGKIIYKKQRDNSLKKEHNLR